jgi:hypothetical protein
MKGVTSRYYYPSQNQVPVKISSVAYYFQEQLKQLRLFLPLRHKYFKSNHDSAYNTHAVTLAVLLHLTNFKHEICVLIFILRARRVDILHGT